MHAPVAQEIHYVGPLLGPAGVHEVALAAGLHEHAVALADVYKADREGPRGRRVGPAGRTESPAGREGQDQDEQSGGKKAPRGRSQDAAGSGCHRRSLRFPDGARRDLPASFWLLGYTARYGIYFSETGPAAKTGPDKVTIGPHGDGESVRDKGARTVFGGPSGVVRRSADGGCQLLAAVGGQPVDPLVGLRAGQVGERLADAALEALDAAVAGPLDG